MIVKFEENKTLRIWFKYVIKKRERLTMACAEFDADERLEFIAGVAKCCAADQFVKATGRRIALEHLLAEPFFTREMRTAVWREYFATHRDLKGNKKEKQCQAEV